MCLAIFKSKNVKLKKETLENSYKANGNGCGFAFIENGKMKIVKGMFEFENFWNQFNEIQEKIESPMLVHFRIATSGEVDDFNCHPWVIDEDHAVIHNGILYDFSAPLCKVSDTGMFVWNILKPMFKRDKGFFQTKFGKYLIEEAIGGYNKLVILNTAGEYVIFNESAGYWDEGVWYSNLSYLPPKPKHSRKNSKNVFNHGKKKKPSKYHEVGSREILTHRQINELTHKHHCKLVDLVRKHIVEPIPIEDEMPEAGTPAYVEYWLRRGFLVTV